MSMLAPAPKQASRYVEILKDAAEKQDGQTEWVVIAHNDQEMQRKVSQVFETSSYAVLEMPQVSWDFGSEEMISALDWAINESGAKNLLFVGHSSACDDPTDHSRPCEFGKNLLADIQRTEKSTRKAKEQFAEKIESVFRNGSLSQAFIDGGLQMYALFYLAPGKSFLVYDPREQAYRPLA